MEYRNEGVWGQTWERGSEAYRSSSYLKYQEAIRGSTRIVNPLSQTGFSSAPKLRTKERLLRDSEPNHWLRLAKPERMTETPRETAHAGYRTQGWVRQRPITNQLSSTSAGFRPLESHLEDPNKQILELNKKVDGLATQFQTMTAILLDYNKLGYHPEMPPQNHLMGRTSLSTGSRRPYLEHDEKSAHYSIHPEPPLAYMSVSKATSDNGMFLKTQIQHSQDKLSRTNIRPVSRGGLSSVSTPNSIGGKKPPSHSGVSVVGERSTSNNFFKPAEFAEDRIKKPATNLDSSPPSKSGSSQNIDAMGPQQLRELRDKIDQRLRTASEM